MPVAYVNGDPLLSNCQTIAIGHNRVGRTEMEDCSLALMRRFPAAYANYERRCKQNRQISGELHLWTQSMPQLLFLTVRDTAVGATRLRYVQRCLMTLARDYRLYNIQSLAIAPLANRHEWAEIKAIIDRLLGKSSLSVVVYEAYQIGLQAES